MKNKGLCLIFCLSVLCTPIFSHGKNDVEEISVENLNSWQENFDLEARTAKKAQKFNIMITASDLGGNTYVEGPYNIWVDPNSDKPICGVTNPYPGMRVVGNLNIVGTCVDDDGVSRVELILDEGQEQESHVTADGKEFWSYYLDTNNLEEGPHTIKVIGYDINSEPVASEPYVVAWQLDRKQPVTAVDNLAMGELVSGLVNFRGTVNDGNGIKALSYSLDGGKNFSEVKLAKSKGTTKNFVISVDTKKFEDGPAVLWFKAVDNATSVGVYAHLYYIDNTKPDVNIVYPEPDAVMNGKFTIAGYVKDNVGLESLSWTFGEQSGEFELIPGNPYWALDVDTIGLTKEKSRRVTITARDRAKNVVTVSKTINLNQEDDKPVVTITEPADGQAVTAEDGHLFVRGIAVDDDSVQSVRIQLDDNEPVVQETFGVFHLDFGEISALTAGNHKITVTGIDENGVEGNSVSATVSFKGLAPSFENASVNSGKASAEFVNGMTIHPESGSTFGVKVVSPVGLLSVKTKCSCGGAVISENEIPLQKAPALYDVSLPVTPEFAKGLVIFDIQATDILNRISNYRAVMYITNTTVIKNPVPILVFDDSTIGEDGSVINNSEFSATGYLIGATAASAELVPATPFARAMLRGNQIKLVPGDAVGSSEPVVVRVKTTDGRTVDSKPLVFKNDNVLPVITFNQDNSSAIIAEGEVSITGKVSCETGVGSLSYRIWDIPVEAKNGVITKLGSASISSDLQKLNVASNGEFSLKLDSTMYADGYYIVEFIAESAGGNQAANAIGVSKLPILPEGSAMKAPLYTFVDGLDVYGAAVFQGTLDQNFMVFPRTTMNEGSNAIEMTATDENGGPTTGKYTAVKQPSLSASFALIGDEPYYSGLPVQLPYGNSASSKISLYIDTGAAINSVTYEISGAEVPGGVHTQTGSVKPVKQEDSNRWVADIPLSNLPARINHIKAVIKAGTLEKTVTGSFAVIRPDGEFVKDDETKIYSLPDENSYFDSSSSSWILANGSKFHFYVNTERQFTASLENAGEGLTITTEGKLVTLSAEKDGIYKGIRLKVQEAVDSETGIAGAEYKSEALNFSSDSQAPEINLLTPQFQDWVGTFLSLSGTAADAIGIKSVEYSLNNGQTWSELHGKFNANNTGVTFSESVDISHLADGLVKLDVRSVDVAGHTSRYSTAFYKDVTPPEVTVVEPLADDIVNGENTIVFRVKDNAKLASAEYVMGKTSKTAEIRNEIPLGHLTYTLVGTPEQPINDVMSFVFKDKAGNKTPIEYWSFVIDNTSDLPRAEIYVPDENQVITRDFKISGILYDDDGSCTAYYKIDNGNYKQVSLNEVYNRTDPAAEYAPGTSFEIEVPFSEMTDNEHTITMYAVDVNGVKGEEVVRNFRVSLEEPKGEVVTPSIETSVRDVITISGVASDKNGIEKIELSLDNGNSYNDAVGTENWSYSVDTRAIPGGTQVVFLRVTDKYGITGLYSSLLNVDNNPPEISLDLPLDDSTSSGELFFSGSSFDNVGITDLFVTVRALDSKQKTEVHKLKIDQIISQTVDLSNIEDGFYNIELTGEDKAGNKTNVSRNIHLDKSRAPAVVDVLYPLNGEHKNGKFNIYGQAETSVSGGIQKLMLYVDGIFVKETLLSSSGFFKFEISPVSEKSTGEYDENGKEIKTYVSDMSDGVHTYRVDAVLANGRQIASREQTITYSSLGPWITLDNFTYGTFATNRPYLRGSAGYSISPDEVVKAHSKEATKDEKLAIAQKSVEKIEISFDNGKTFTLLSENEKWLYRIENQDLAEGYHFLLIRATMKNGEVAVERTVVQIDNTAPKVRLIAPEVGGRYNQVLDVSGLSSDDVGIEKVNVTLRKGDKSSYEIPSFIQGLYLDFHFWGATLFDIGAGLTFFNDVVKVQVQWGQFTQSQRDMISNTLSIPLSDMRYGGDNVWGLKIIANIASIPFSFFFGHDFDWLFAKFALGAQFTRFNQTNSGDPQILSAILGQMEFPYISWPGAKVFSKFSVYTEFSVWFIPTDVAGAENNIIPQVALGLRTNIF